MFQRTLANNINVTGVGLHSGERVHLGLYPAVANSGIMFQGEQSRIIRLTPDLINDTRLSSTVVTNDGIRIGTIEHIMSAFAAYGIDNILVELNAPEIPIMDGSSLPFIYLLQDAGVIDQNAEKRFLRIKKTVTLIIRYLIAVIRLFRLILPVSLILMKYRAPEPLVLCRKWN